MGNPYASKTGTKKVEPKEDLVPGGTIKEVLEWVGDDKDRAERALAEEKKNANRKTLVADLEEVLAEEDEEVVEEEEEDDLDD